MDSINKISRLLLLSIFLHGCTLGYKDDFEVKEVVGTYNSSFKNHVYMLVLKGDGKFYETSKGKNGVVKANGTWRITTLSGERNYLELNGEVFPRNDGKGFRLGIGNYYLEKEQHNGVVSAIATEGKTFTRIMNVP